MDRGLVVDLVALAMVIVLVVRAWKRRTIRELAALIATLLAVFVAGLVASAFGPRAASALTDDPNLARVVTAAAVFALVVAIVSLVTRRFVRGVEIGGPRWLDRAGGMWIAAMRAAVFVWILLFGLLSASAAEPDMPGFAQGVEESVSGAALASPSSPLTTGLDGLLTTTPAMEGVSLWARQQTEFRVRVPEDRLVFEPVRVDLEARPQQERELFRLVNEAREAQGLDPYRWCGECARVARAHSRDMYSGGYFSHVNRRGQDPFERLRAADITYQAAGENLAIAASVDDAHRGLIGSPEHRANLLRTAFDGIGIGIYEGPYGLMCTQVFIRSP